MLYCMSVCNWVVTWWCFKCVYFSIMWRCMQLWYVALEPLYEDIYINRVHKLVIDRYICIWMIICNVKPCAHVPPDYNPPPPKATAFEVGRCEGYVKEIIIIILASQDGIVRWEMGGSILLTGPVEGAAPASQDGQGAPTGKTDSCARGS